MSIAVLFPNGLDLNLWREVELGVAFDESTFEFLDALSKDLLSLKETRSYPELIALGYWLRPANLEKIKDRNISQHIIYRPVGSVLHIAPGNVETLFFYSSVLSLLMGNRNVVRVSTRRGRSFEILLNAINKIYLGSNKFKQVAARLVFVDFPRNRKDLAALSSEVDLRIIWGGDSTVNDLRTIPLPAHAREITFPDKFSLCLLGAKAITKGLDLSDVISGFVKDAYMFAQQACSSPRYVVWVGTKIEISEAKDRFWTLVESQCDSGKLKKVLSLAEQSDSLAGLHSVALCCEGVRVENIRSKWVNRVLIKTIDENVEKMHKGSGLFFEISIERLEDLTSFLRNRHQTLSYWGVSLESIISWLEKESVQGIDRVVPVGASLDFDYIWDGVNMIQFLSRQLAIKKKNNDI